MAEFDPNKPFELEAPAEFDSNKPFELEAPAEFDSNKPFELEKSVNSDDLNEPSTDEGWAKELGEGVVEGLTKIPQGIIELGLEGVDYVADTQNARQFNLWADKTRKDFGIDPEGAVGTIASGLTQFAVPGLGAASVVSKLSKLGKLKKGYAQGKNFGFGLTKTQKVALATQQAVAAGVADAVVTTDGTQTIGDFFDGGFTGTDVYNVADSGSEDAARRIGNRFSMLIEGGALAGTIPPVLSGIGKGLVKAGSSNLSGVPQVSKVINAGLEKATKYVAKLDELDMSQGLKNEETGKTVRKMTAFENFNFFLARNLRSRGALLGAKKGVQKQETNRSIKIFDKDTNEEILFNGEKRSFKSEEEAYANFREMVNEEVKQLPEWRSIEETITRGAKDSPEYKDLQYQRMRNADNPNIDSDLIDQQQRIINKELTDAQDEILQQNYLTREQKTKTISMDVSKGVAGTEETIDTAKLFSLIGPVQEAAFKVATDQFQRLEKQIDKVLAQPKYLKQSNLSKEKILNNLYDYFTGKTIVSEDNLFKEIGIPKELEIPIKKYG